MQRATSILTLCLVSFWPFVSFLNHNRRELLEPWPVLVYGALFCAAVLAALALLHLVFRRAPLARLCILLSVGVILFFLYGVLDIAAKDLEVSRARYILATWALLTTGLAVLAWRLSARAVAPQVAAVAALVLVSVPMAQYLKYLAFDRGGPEPKQQSTAAPAEAPAVRPSVYYVILDGYARADTLNELFEFENSRFLDDLRGRGFFIAGQSRANYPMTALSVSATLQMDYHEAGKGVMASMAPYQYKLNGFNRTVRRFRDYGYRYVHGQAGGWIGLACGGNEDMCLTGERRSGGITEVEVELLRSTPLLVVLQALFPDLVRFDALTLPRVEAAISGLPIRPRFVLAHILSVHDYRYHADCSLRSGGLEGLRRDIGEDEFSAYRDTVVCVNGQVLSFVDAVLKDEPGAIVILQSDHGPDIGGMFEKPFTEWTEPELRYRYGILNAIRLPRRCGDGLYESISPVNTFRAVFACIESRPLELLPDRSFYASYHGEDVEEILER
ncbi:MAG: hypothetical protein QNJ92_00595 [Alphaproteobacteria bacterium]|nr:hypothetical protein [Alphaproteobacteria bacterium]